MIRLKYLVRFLLTKSLILKKKDPEALKKMQEENKKAKAQLLSGKQTTEKKSEAASAEPNKATSVVTGKNTHSNSNQGRNRGSKKQR